MTYSQDAKTEQPTEPSFKSTDNSRFTQPIQSFGLPIQIMFQSLNGKRLSAQGCRDRKSLYKSQYHRSHKNCEFWCQLWKYSIWFPSCRKMFKICLSTGSLFLLHQCSRSKQCKTGEWCLRALLLLQVLVRFPKQHFRFHSDIQLHYCFNFMPLLQAEQPTK